jgi:hypothetical protein
VSYGKAEGIVCLLQATQFLRNGYDPVIREKLFLKKGDYLSENEWFP